MSISACSSDDDKRGISSKKQDKTHDSRTESRIALVIGNSNYSSSPLRNPVNDARAIAKALQRLGFEVVKGENLSRKDMGDKILRFGQKLEGEGSVGLFYFAGHGVQVNGKNYLIPIGANITREKQVVYEGIDVNQVMIEMEGARNPTNIVILDACRDNPFVRSFRSSAQGLASIDAPTGTLIAYATAPGKTAVDGEGDNGLYTGELVKWMQEPGLKIEDIFKKVRTSVRESSNGEQIPWESSSLEGDFYFYPSKSSPPPKVSIVPPEAKPGFETPSPEDKGLEETPKETTPPGGDTEEEKKEKRKRKTLKESPPPTSGTQRGDEWIFKE